MKQNNYMNIIAGICLIMVSNAGCGPSENITNHRDGMAAQAVPAAYSTPWEARMAAATTAYKQGRYTDAEKSLQAALMEAEHPGKGDLRYTMTLIKLRI